MIYDFHYNFIKKKFDAEILFTGTDSLAYERKSEDVYEDFFKHKHLFDFSNYPNKDSKFFNETNRKVIGKMKDEFGIVEEFVGLKSKMKSMKNIDGKESNVAKGVNIATEFNEFKDVLFNKNIRRKMRMRLLGQFQFFTRKFYAQKSTKNIKSTKSTKTQTSEQATFLPLDVFYAHKNATFFVFVRSYGFVCLFAFC